jgi:hypothetical protein
MPISDATIRRVKYPPELLPDAWFGNVPALAEVVVPVLDLRRFSPFLLALTGIQLVPNANVVLRARYDDIRLEEATAAMYWTGVTGLPGAWYLLAKQYLYLNFLGVGPTANYPTFYGVWAQKPTIAHKLVHGITLSSEEKAIADKLGVADTVDKGLLPLPISQQIEREYYVLGEETKSRVITLAAPATDYGIESIYARANEIIVLTRIASFPSAGVPVPGDNVQLLVDRDEDQNFLTIPTLPLSTILGGEVECFIPALHELRLHTTCAAAPAFPQLFRYTIKRIRLSNILRARFGLVGPDELPGDTWSKVTAGIL